MKSIIRTSSKIKDLLGCFDFKCIGCGADTFDKPYCICDDCLKLFSFVDGRVCDKCGRQMLGEGNLCRTCLNKAYFFEKCYSAMTLEGRMREVIHSFKFGGMVYLALQLEHILADVAVKRNIDFDIVCYAPMSDEELADRGYSQTQLLAESFCDILAINPPQPVLKKVRETLRQEKLNFKEREINLLKSVTVTDRQIVKDKRILVIDDVLTTFATLN